MSVQYPALKKGFPWITATIPYSDQCGDYRSTAATVFNHEMGRLSGLRVKLVLHSEVGEGKGEVDMRLGQKSQQFVSILARLPRTCAADLFTHLQLCAGVGDYNLELAISLQLFKEGSSGALPFLEQCAAVEYPVEGGLVLREIHGYGPGVLMSRVEVKSKDHYGIMDAAETGSYSLQQSEGGMTPQRRDSENSKKQAVGERNQKRKDKEQKRREKVYETADLLAAVEPKSKAWFCAACGGSRYLSEETFHRHFENGTCERRKAKFDVSRSPPPKSATVVVSERRASRLASDSAAIAGSGELEYIFTSSEESIALELVAVGKCAAVYSVSHDQKILATKVLSEFTVKEVSIKGQILQYHTAVSLMDLLKGASTEYPVKVIFSKLHCPMPMRGYARKRLHKETKKKLTETQRNFLTAFCDAHETTQSQPRSKLVFEAMVKKFGDLALDLDTHERIVMDETAIFNWLKTRYTAKKTALAHIAAAAAIQDGES